MLNRHGTVSMDPPPLMHQHISDHMKTTYHITLQKIMYLTNVIGKYGYLLTVNRHSITTYPTKQTLTKLNIGYTQLISSTYVENKVPRENSSTFHPVT